MESEDHESPKRNLESDGSYCLTEYLGQEGTNIPTVICFHGSGTNHVLNWKPLLANLSRLHRVVFLDRGSQNPPPEEHIKTLWKYLNKHNIRGPYILVAHSYGGAFAKQFLYAHHDSVRGMVLVETGKGESSGQLQLALIKKARLGSKALCVIRANPFLRQQQDLEVERANHTKLNAALQARAEWLKQCQVEDERLEKAQLKLSRHSKLIYLPHCGHNVVRDRSDVILQEVGWVVEQDSNPIVRSAPFARAIKFFSRSG